MSVTMWAPSPLEIVKSALGQGRGCEPNRNPSHGTIDQQPDMDSFQSRPDELGHGSQRTGSIGLTDSDAAQGRPPMKGAGGFVCSSPTTV